MKTHADTSAGWSAHCAGPNEFENFDRAFRTAPTARNGAVLNEDKRWKRERAKKISVPREEALTSKEQADARRIKSVELSMIEAEIFFDLRGNLELAEKRVFGTSCIQPSVPTLSSAGGVGYWKATDEEIDASRQKGYALADWRNLSVADIAEQYPDRLPPRPKVKTTDESALPA